MRLLLDASLFLSYSQFYVTDGDAEPGYDGAFVGQVNGLVGAGLPGNLTVCTGTHTGHVGVRVLLADAEPPLEDGWEDVVDVSLNAPTGAVTVVGCMGDEAHEVQLPPGDLRVRCLASGVDAGRSEEVPSGAAVERYELVVWPAPPAPDVVVRAASEGARYLHRQQDPAAVRADLEAVWDGDVPSARVQRDPAARHLASTRRGFVDALDASPPGVLRALSGWAVATAVREAGVHGVDWLVAAARDVVADQPLPRDVTPWTAYERLEHDPGNPRETVVVDGNDVDTASQVLFLLFQVVGDDAFGAALSGVLGLRGIVGDALAEEFLDLAEVELDRLRDLHPADVADPRPESARGYAEPEPEPYLGGPDEVWPSGEIVVEIVLDEGGGVLDPEAAAVVLGRPPATFAETPSTSATRGFGEQVVALEAVEPDVVRTTSGPGTDPSAAVAAELVGRLCAASGIADLPWVADALTAARHERRLPEPFVSRAAVEAWVRETGGGGPVVTVEGVPQPQVPLVLEAVARLSAFPSWSNRHEAFLTVLHAVVFAVDDDERVEVLRSAVAGVLRAGGGPAE